MTKVLGKALGILEAAALASPEAVSLAELAKSLNINKATCSRLAGELVDEGYLEQKSRLSGFTAGPRAWAFGRRAKYAEELLAAAREPLRACAQACGQAAMLAILKEGRRYVLLHESFNKDSRIELRKLAFADSFYTATGIVLLAHAPEELYERTKELSPESSQTIFEELGSEAKFKALLKQVAAKGSYVSHKSFLALSAAAFPVFKDGACVAAFGVSAPRAVFEDAAKRKRIVDEAGRTASEISQKLAGVGAL